jgi:hypothetical protein
MRTILIATAALAAMAAPAFAQTQSDHNAHHPNIATAAASEAPDGQTQGQMQPNQMPGGMMGQGGQGSGGMMGMMGQGGQGQGMMGQGGMMGGMGLGPCAMVTGQPLDLTADEAKTLLQAMLIRHGNDRLQAGAVEDEDGKLIASIETVDGSLVRKVAIDAKTGMMAPAE